MAILSGALSLRDSPHHLRVLGLFILISFVAIFSTTLILSAALSRYVVKQMMLRDALVSVEFLNSVVHVEDAESYFRSTTETETPADIEEFLIHVSLLPEVFRANIYGSSGEILWSSDPELIGQHFPDNEELAEAMRGRMNPELDVVSRGAKEEHVGFPDGIDEYIEYYMPIWSEDALSVVGAVEVYKAPKSLLATIHRLRAMTWIGALIAGAGLFGGLAVVVIYSTRILQRQEARLVETERLAVVGEMASAVAHGLRNPLAAIRSCAELTLDDDIPETSRASIRDITLQVDRLEGWIRSFLIRGRKDPSNMSDHAQIDHVIEKCIENFRSQLDQRGIEVRLQSGAGSPVVLVQASELEQVLNSVISNGIEAMQHGGQLGISWRHRPGAMIEVQVTDTGPGIPPEMLERVFTPFETGKSYGLGVGLALGRRIIERLGGTLDLANGINSGVRVTLTVPAQG
jgi:two-component system, NtrC family, sensor histidine kinase HydH